MHGNDRFKTLSKYFSVGVAATYAAAFVFLRQMSGTSGSDPTRASTTHRGVHNDAAAAACMCASTRHANSKAEGLNSPPPLPQVSPRELEELF